LQDNHVGESFFDGSFSWQTSDDPTGGRVNYVDMPTAQALNVSYVNGDKFVMRADDQNVVTSGRGRNSMRIASTKAYRDSVIVMDIEHMPYGCSQWPAFWTLTTGNWPDGGEIDMLEGINTHSINLGSLHTSSGCTMPDNRDQKGHADTTDCNANVNDDSGCGTSFSSTSSYGQGLNNNGGGWFVMKRTDSDGVSMYFWPRNDKSVPDDVRTNTGSVSPSSSWGKPEGVWPTSQCDFASHFTEHNIVINLTFCGAWAGNEFGVCGQGDCNTFVDQNPQAFTEAYWEINSLRVYT